MFFGFNSGPYLAFHVCLFFTAAVRLLLQFRQKSLRDLIVTINYVALFVLWVFWQAIGQTSLVPADFIHPLQLPAFLMLADWMKQSSDEIAFPGKSWIQTIFLLWFALFFSIPFRTTFNSNYIYIVPLSYCLLLAGLGFIFLRRSPMWVKSLSVIAIACTYSLLSYEPRHAFPKCHYRSEAHDAIIDIILDLQKIEKNPSSVFYYGSGEILVPRKNSCGRLGLAPIYKIMETSRDIMGHNLSYKFPAPKIEELTKNDFHDLVRRKGVLVLFPFDSQDFKNLFLRRAEELGIDLALIETNTVKVTEFRIKYEVYRAK
jgi:hypothetical protein